jgi:hypothetical protein
MRFAAILCVAGLLALCGCFIGNKPFDPNGSSAPKLGSFAGTLTLSGPLPVYDAYDGFNPLAWDLDIALRRPADGRLIATGSAEIERLFRGRGPVAVPYSITTYDTVHPEGPYDLQLVGIDRTNGTTLGYLDGAYNLYVLQELPAVQLEHATDVTGLDLTYNASGPGPYADVSGTFWLSGHPVGLAQVVLKPQVPQPGVDPGTGLLWQVWEVANGYEDWRIDYTVRNLSYGDYELSYAGPNLRDADDPLSVTVRNLTVDQPTVAAQDFHVTASWAPAADQYGVARGTLSGTPQHVVIRATHESYLLQPSALALCYDQVFADEWTAGGASFELTHLVPGRHFIDVLSPAGAVLAAAQTIEISSASTTVEALAFEVP